jgi:hypothetical protein
VPIILIPLIWLAAMTFVVAACQVAARADGCQPSPTLGEKAPDERAAVDQHQVPDHVESSRRRTASAGERGAMLHQTR